MDFTRYSPGAVAGSRADVAVRSAVAADVPRWAAMLAAHDGRAEREHRERLRRRLHERRGCMLVAEVPGPVLAGAGRVVWLEPGGGGDGPAGAAPAGWYLVGLVVDPAHRRAGIGEALTRARLAWVLERAGEAWYFANAANRASLDLHARLGFVEVTRDFTIPGVEFEGGVGVLGRHRATRAPPVGGSTTSSRS